MGTLSCVKSNPRARKSQKAPALPADSGTDTGTDSATADRAAASSKSGGRGGNGGRSGATGFILSHPVIAAFLTAIAFLLVVALVLGTMLFLRARLVNQSGRTEALPGEDRTIAFLGLDGEGDQFEAKRSDAIMLIRIRENPHWIDVVSIPRDSQVKMPDCTGKHAGETDKLNAAYAYGSVADTDPDLDSGDPAAAGMACAAKTISDAAGITVNDTVAVTFSGLTDTIDALGGVDVPVSSDGLIIRDAEAEGAQIKHFSGAEILQQLRARKGVADGSDLSRISRQQEVLGAVLDYYRQSGVVDNRGIIQTAHDFATLNNMILKETKHTLGLGDLQELLKSVVSTPVNFTTLPTSAADDGVNVVWGSQAEQFWQSYRDGTDLPN